MARPVRFSFLRGTGSSLEVLYGQVSITPSQMHTLASSAVLPAPTTLDLVDGVAVAPSVVPTPVPVDGKIAWAYVVKVTNTHGKSWEYMVGVPDGTTEINFNVLPRYYETKPEAFGEGPPGPAGTAATIAVGSVTSGPTPAVTNSGTSTDAVLNFTLAKGDKGDTGTGVPTGGTALQVVRKNAGNTATEWATVDKSLVGLGNVDNTSDANKPVSTAQKEYIDSITVLPDGSKHFSAPPSDYPAGTSTLLASVSSGWPAYSDGITSVLVTTERSKGPQVVSLQWITGVGGDIDAPVWFRTSNLSGAWSQVRHVVEGNTNKITLGVGALGNLATDYDVGSTGTVVSLGHNAHGKMVEVKKSVAIGVGALSQGLRSRDNVAIGEDAGWATESASADYVQSNRGGTRNVMIGGAAGRSNKTGIGHVLIGRGAGASIVSGNGAVVIGSNANTGSQPIGLSGEIEDWGSYFEGNPETRTRLVSIGAEASWANSGYGITAVGDRALTSNTKGDNNTALGSDALSSLGRDTWINGGLYKTESQVSGTYIHTGNRLELTVNQPLAAVGDIIRLRLLTGGSATFMADKVFAVVIEVSAGKITVTHPKSSTASGDAFVDAVISPLEAPKASSNVGVGSGSAKSLVKGTSNTAVGFDAGRDVVDGSNNVFVGSGAGRFLKNGHGNLAIGYLSGNLWVDGTNMENASGVVTIGQHSRASANNQMQLGSPAVTTYAYGAVQDRSDMRDKADVRDTVLGLEFIEKLRPVDFKWDFRDDYEAGSNRDGSKKRGRYHHGLIAQEVQKVIGDSGVDFGGFQDHTLNGGSDVLTIGYGELIAPLIKAVQELSAKVDELSGK